MCKSCPAFYDRIQVEHAAAAAGVLARETAFAPRLHGVLEAWLMVAAPDHVFAGQFLHNAVDPASPLSPFSPESAQAREAGIALFRTLVDGSDVKLAPALRAELPELLWLAQMGVVLFWVYDASEGQRRTHALLERVVPLVDRLVRLSRLPVVRRIVDDLVALVADLRRG